MSSQKPPVTVLSIAMYAALAIGVWTLMSTLMPLLAKYPSWITGSTGAALLALSWVNVEWLNSRKMKEEGKSILTYLWVMTFVFGLLLGKAAMNHIS
jgi:hypothetical protein